MPCALPAVLATEGSPGWGSRSGRPDQDGATAGQMPGNCCSEDQRDPGIPYWMRVARGLLCDVRDRRD